MSKGFNPFPLPPPKPLKFGPVTDAADRAAARKTAQKLQRAVVKSRDVAKAKAAAPKATSKAAPKNAAKAQQLSKAKNYVTTQRLKNVGTSVSKAPSSSTSAAPPRTGAGSGASSGGRSLYSRLTGGLMKHGR